MSEKAGRREGGRAVHLFEAMETCRAIRFFKEDPVPEEMIEKMVYAETRAPSPGKSQGGIHRCDRPKHARQIAPLICCWIPNPMRRRQPSGFDLRLAGPFHPSTRHSH